MKTIRYLFILCLISSAILACGVQKTAAELAAEKQLLKEKIENRRFEFSANYVIPMGQFQSRYLTSPYGVKVTNDTIYSHLPYFGVAYEAPWNPSESPLVFNSTVFNYSATTGNRAGSWIVSIEMSDKQRPVRYTFTIWENGKADLVVWNFARQAISFRGEIKE